MNLSLCVSPRRYLHQERCAGICKVRQEAQVHSSPKVVGIGNEHVLDPCQNPIVEGLYRILL